MVAIERLRPVFIVLLTMTLLAWASPSAQAQTSGARATRAEALALADKATTYMEEHGIDAAREAFADPDGEFQDRDLYVTILDFEGNMIAHGKNPKLVGKNLMALKDLDGVPFIRNAIELVKQQDQGWVSYKWTDPLTKKVAAKDMHVRRIGDYILNVGVYQKE